MGASSLVQWAQATLGANSSVLLPLARDARARAHLRLPRLIFDFIDGAAGEEMGSVRNESEFARIQLMPRVLLDVAAADLSTRFLGRTTGLPLGIAPMGMCDLAWPGADRMLAAEAVRRDIPLCVSTATSTTLEEMLALTSGRAWFQLYVTGSIEAAFALADRAQAVGYETLALTVDVPKLGIRPRDLRNGFATPFRWRPRHLLDFATHPRWSLATLKAGVPRMANFASGPQANGYDRQAARTGADWTFLDRLRERWRGKLVIKGVLSPVDARRIRSAGADAVYVSNHGGRQLDSAPAPIAMLPAIRAAVGADYPLVLDGGVRSGEDVLKALACGADFVMLGRPFLYAVAAGGAPGLGSFVDNLVAGLGVALAQVGLKRVADLDGRVLLAPAPSVAALHRSSPVLDGAPREGTLS